MFLALTANRTKMVQLMTKLSAVDTALDVFSDNLYTEHRAKMLLCVAAFALCVLPTYGVFIYFWESDQIANGLSLSLADFTWLMHDLETVNVVMLLQERLSLLSTRILSVLNTELHSCRTVPVPSAQFGTLRMYRRVTTSHSGSCAEFPGLPTVVQYLKAHRSVPPDTANCQCRAREGIVSCRKIYGQLYGICGCINGIYGLTLLLSTATRIVCFVSHVTVTVRFMVRPEGSTGSWKEWRGWTGWTGSVSRHEVVPFLISSLLTAVSMMVVAVPCQKAGNEHQNCRDSVQEVLLRSPHAHLVTQLRLFSNQLENNRIEFTAYGFFLLNLSLLSTLTGVTVTYIILLVQV
jgi:hypothetical protein